MYVCECRETLIRLLIRGFGCPRLVSHHTCITRIHTCNDATHITYITLWCALFLHNWGLAQYSIGEEGTFFNTRPSYAYTCVLRTCFFYIHLCNAYVQTMYTRMRQKCIRADRENHVLSSIRWASLRDFLFLFWTHNTVPWEPVQHGQQAHQ